MRNVCVVCLAAVVAVLGGCGGGSGNEEVADGPATCEAVEAPAPRDDGGASKPSRTLEDSVTYRLEFATNCGHFTVTLDTTTAPETTASLVSLARAGFYDGTTIHRVSPGFVIQGGDPTGTGSGGPGYKTIDAPPADAGYTHGVFAMAKTAAEAAGTAGSQWFVVTAENAQLPPDYAIAGKVTEGLDVVDRIGAIPSDPATEKPSEVIVVSKVTVTRTREQ